MSNFWNNIYKFPRFLISIMIGFFLITFQPIFKLLKKKKNLITFSIILIIIVLIFYKIILKMTGVE
uniref:Uncharacterized protein ycf33 n=1 Tax=Lophocladia kuetzingii TaxID=675577 RepID=A0A1Z1MP66_9FLOR|nr:hypothetical protein [Lophocladia kuetzingii]ARW67736.1 hypothetical protein [Lophocladia kuetzingii]